MSYCLVGLLCKILGVYNLGILAYSMCVLGLCGFLYTIYLTPSLNMYNMYVQCVVIHVKYYICI